MPLIVLEGIDGTGKSTQATLLAEWLAEVSDQRVIHETEPTHSHFGEMIRTLAGKPRAKIDPWTMHAMFTMDRMEHVRSTITPALSRNEIVILDRYYYSTAAYQGAFGVPPERILADNMMFAPKPDLVFVLLADPKLLRQRIKKRGQKLGGLERVFEKSTAYQEKVQAIYQDLVQQDDSLLLVEAEYSVDLIHQALCQMVKTYLPELVR